MKLCANFGKCATETLAIINPGFRKESMSHTRKLQIYSDKKRARQVKSKAKSMLIIFFGIKGIVHKEFVLAGQTVNSAYYCDVLQRLSKNM
jgi:hypothetical protein